MCVGVGVWGVGGWGGVGVCVWLSVFVCVCVCVCVCVQACGHVSVCVVCVGWGVGGGVVKERKPGRVPACMGKNWAMDNKSNALTVNILFFVCLFVCLFVCSIPFTNISF